MLEEFKGIFRRPNNAHTQLVIINVVIFLIMAVVVVVSKISGFEGVSRGLIREFTIPANIHVFLERPWTLLTYAFAHSLHDVFHIFFNMLVFYWFGRLFVEYLGGDRLIALYLLGALGGGAAYLLAFNTIPYFMQGRDTVGMLGASAAVYAIVVGTAAFIPGYTFYLIFFGPVKIKYIALLYIVLSFIGTIGENSGGNIAHLGGAAIGYLYIRRLQVGVDWGGWITQLLNKVKSLFRSRPIKMEFTEKAKPKPTSKRKADPDQVTEDVSQAEIDAILDKISEGGYASLTKEEKEKLFRASKK